MPVNDPVFDPVADLLAERAGLVAGAPIETEVRKMLSARRDRWSKEQNKVGVTLAYARGTGDAISLLHAPEAGPWETFTAPNSLRDVEQTSNLLLRLDDPSEDMAARFPSPPAAPSAATRADAADEAAAHASDAADQDDLEAPTDAEVAS
jgi:hypothetical protein